MIVGEIWLSQLKSRIIVETKMLVIQRKMPPDFRTPLTDFRSQKSFLNIKKLLSFFWNRSVVNFLFHLDENKDVLKIIWSFWNRYCVYIRAI